MPVPLAVAILLMRARWTDVRACKRGLSHVRVREISWVRELLQNDRQNMVHLLTASVRNYVVFADCHCI